MRKLSLLVIFLGLAGYISVTSVYAEEKLEKAKRERMSNKSEIASKFIGTWRLVSVEARRPNGEVAPTPARYGAKPMGYLMYDNTGHVAVQIMRPDRPKFAVSDIDKGTPEELKAAWEGYSAYLGTYEINEAEGFVVHHVEISSFPNYVGSDQKRFYELSGDTLVLKPPQRQVGNEQLNMRITWQRVK
ncbi:MAG: lipocalin-like domain-containing protein [Deltaproteobacteria bacterium]|nr:lipocalin-like domain-containing protein [Deltaproteobacteria bacterium]